jgi:outer membrane protein assembly factor BamD
MACDVSWRTGKVWAKQTPHFHGEGRRIRLGAGFEACMSETVSRRSSSTSSLVALKGVILALAVLGASAGLSACTTSVVGTKEAYAEDEPAGNLYNEGLAYMNAGKLGDAIKRFDEVDRQHPYTEWARKSLIMSTFASFRHGDYEDVVSSGTRYLTLYPGSPDAAYAQYLIGESYFRRVPEVTRDQGTTQKAMAAMQEVVARYPDSEYANDAHQKIIVARDQLAGKEMQIGRYYLERREYLAAINRFKAVVTDYQDTRHVEEALERLAEANMAMGLVSEAQTAAAVLGHNFPDSPWYKDAYKLLQTGGVEPREDRGSWISKVFGAKKTS